MSADYSARSGGLIGISCLFALTQYTIYIIEKKITPDYPKSARMGFFSKGLKNEFETALVNERSVFEPLKFYYINLAVRQGFPLTRMTTNK